MGAAGAAVAILIRQEKEIVRAFQARGATTLATAVPVESLQVHTGRALRILQSHAVIRPGPNGTFWLDEPSWEATRRLRHRLALCMIVVVVALGIATALGVSVFH